MLQLSPFVMPQFRMGAVRISPLNLAERPERVAFVRGYLEHLAELVDLARGGAVTRDNVEAFRMQTHLGTLFAAIDWTDPESPRLTPWEHAEDWVSFDEDRVGVVLMDGRLRSEREMIFIPTGSSTPALSALLARLARGIARPDLLTIAGDLGVELDDEFIDHLIARGAIDNVDAATTTHPRFTAAAGDRLTWLGESSIIFQSGSSTVWVDAQVPPRLRFVDSELPEAFSPASASTVFMPPPYGPAHEQLVFAQLPVPDAVVISHEDADTLDLGMLACLPPETTIVVPAARPDRPWQLDLARMLPRLLGERRIVRLAHGETLKFGDLEVCATPWIGEWPTALPVDWNTYVVRGRDAAAILPSCSAVLPEHLPRLVELVGACGPRSVLCTYDLYPGPLRTIHGFREEPDHLFHAARAWPWFVPMERLFEPNPVWGVSADVARTLGAQCGLRRFAHYGTAGAAWNTFRMPHVHRQNLPNLPLAALDAQRATAASIGWETLPLQIGVPTPL